MKSVWRSAQHVSHEVFNHTSVYDKNDILLDHTCLLGGCIHDTP